MQEIHDRVPSWTDLEVRNLLGQVRLTGENVFNRWAYSPAASVQRSASR